MSTTRDTLPREATFEPDGHLAEAALTCIADGETDLVPAAALAHLDACEHCTRLLGEAALFSIAAEEALVSQPEVLVAPVAVLPAKPVPVPLATMGETPKPPARPAPAEALAPRRRRPLPVAAIAAALFIALVTAGPSLIEGVRGVPGSISAAASTLPFLVRMAEAFARTPWGHSPGALFFKCASALVLAAIGLQVARVTSRERSLQEGGV
jgi:hypothetical protein